MTNNMYYATRSIDYGSGIFLILVIAAIMLLIASMTGFLVGITMYIKQTYQDYMETVELKKKAESNYSFLNKCEVVLETDSNIENKKEIESVCSEHHHNLEEEVVVNDYINDLKEVVRDDKVLSIKDDGTNNVDDSNVNLIQNTSDEISELKNNKDIEKELKKNQRNKKNKRKKSN